MEHVIEVSKSTYDAMTLDKDLVLRKFFNRATSNILIKMEAFDFGKHKLELRLPNITNWLDCTKYVDSVEYYSTGVLIGADCRIMSVTFSGKSTYDSKGFVEFRIVEYIQIDVVFEGLV